MKEVLDFLKESGVFFVGTVDGNEPKVRPFSFVMEYEGKLCFGTSNKKDIYAQLTKNANVEISASKGAAWLRLKGKAVFCTSAESQAKAIEVMPGLKNMYAVGDGKFEIFYLEDGVANLYSFNGEAKTINL